MKIIYQNKATCKTELGILKEHFKNQKNKLADNKIIDNSQILQIKILGKYYDIQNNKQ